MRTRIVATLAALLSLGTVAAHADSDGISIPPQYKLGSAAPSGGVTVQHWAAAHAAAVAKTASAPVKSTVTNSTATSQSAPAIELPADTPPLDGAFYAEAFPIFPQGDATGNISYLRFGNGNAAPTTFHVIVMGSVTGIDYGEADYVIPAYASPQISFAPDGSGTDIMTQTGTGALQSNSQGTDTLFSLYIRDADDNTFYQNVIFNGGNQFFEDFTICPLDGSVEGQQYLTNVHTTDLAAFPSYVFIHNYLNVSAQYTVVIYDAHTGTLLGTVAALNAEPNSTYEIPFSWFEQQINFTPNTNQEHANLMFQASPSFAKVLDPDDPTVNPATITDIGGIFGSAVYNATLKAYLNLSNKCTVNR